MSLSERDRASALATQICGCATAEQHQRDIQALLSYRDEILAQASQGAGEPVAWPISVDGPNKITDQRAWLARQLLDSKLTDGEAFGIVAYHPDIRSASTSPPDPQEASGEPVAWTGRTHDLKTWPAPYDAVAAGLKPWELRLNDRDYQVGDRLRLRRWVPVAESYSGEETTRQVAWLLKGPAFGLPEGYVIMSLSPPDPQALEGALGPSLR